MPQKIDIPLDQAIALVRACQKLNCDTADELFAMVERRCSEARTALTASPTMITAAWKVLTRYAGPNAKKRDPRSIGTVEVRNAIEAALLASRNRR